MLFMYDVINYCVLECSHLNKVNNIMTPVLLAIFNVRFLKERTPKANLSTTDQAILLCIQKLSLTKEV